MQKGVLVGVDVGGTKVAAGVVDAAGKILSSGRVRMVPNASAQEGLDAVFDAISAAIASAAEPVKGIGICAPGPLDPQTGIILNPPNLPCWRNFPLAELVARRHPVPVRVDNDANAAALAEARWGAARGAKIVFYATIGTGIGTGIVIDGSIYHGRTGAAGEGGHVSIDYRGPVCACGKPGCIEILASGTAITGRARERIRAGRDSLMLELSGAEPDRLTGETIAKAYAAGDRLAGELLSEATDMLALWLGNIVDLLDPDVIVIGGGAAALYRGFFDQLHERITKVTVNPRASEVPVLSAYYGADSGIAGGAALCA